MFIAGRRLLIPDNSLDGRLSGVGVYCLSLYTAYKVYDVSTDQNE